MQNFGKPCKIAHGRRRLACAMAAVRVCWLQMVQLVWMKIAQDADAGPLIIYKHCEFLLCMREWWRSIVVSTSVWRVCVQRTLSWHGGQQWSPRRQADQLPHCPVSPSVHELKPGSVVTSSTPTRVNRALPHGSAVTQTPSPASYKTMYVCNIGECNRGFAYKKNLVTHQRSKHSRDH